MSCFTSLSLSKTHRAKTIENITRIAIATTFGYLAGKMISFINPTCAAIFTAVTSTIQIISNEIFKKSQHSENICFGSVLLSMTTGYVVANYFAKFTILHGLSIFSLGVITIVALQIIMDRIGI